MQDHILGGLELMRVWAAVVVPDEVSTLRGAASSMRSDFRRDRRQGCGCLLTQEGRAGPSVEVGTAPRAWEKRARCVRRCESARRASARGAARHQGSATASKA